MGQTGAISIFKLNKEELSKQNVEPERIINYKEGQKRYTSATWAYDKKHIIAGHSNGEISKIDTTTGETVATVQAHDGTVTDIQMSPDRTYFVTSSKDKTAQLIRVDDLAILHTYSSDSPLNSATITPVKNFVIVGGGQEARDVTTTSSKEGKFESRFHHKLFEDEIGRVHGHFGPINTIAVHPRGTSYASGGEDGYVRVHHFDKSYFDFQFDVERRS